jgi:hypothetical protein
MEKRIHKCRAVALDQLLTLSPGSDVYDGVCDVCAARAASIYNKQTCLVISLSAALSARLIMKSVIYLYQLAADRVSAAPSLLWVRAIKTLDWRGIHFIAALAFSARRLVQQQDNKTDRSGGRLCAGDAIAALFLRNSMQQADCCCDFAIANRACRQLVDANVTCRVYVIARGNVYVYVHARGEKCTLGLLVLLM